jgi:outer membrane protein TolC
MRTDCFDEMNPITHSCSLMQFKRVLLIAVTWCAAHGAFARPPQEAQPASAAQTNAVVDTNLISQIPQPPPRKTRVLSLEDCIALALQHNLDIQIQKYNPVIGQYKVGVDVGAYEPTFSFSASKSYNDRPGGINPATGLPFLPNLSRPR